MKCTASPYSQVKLKPVSEHIMENIMSFPDSVRKIVRLLCKQYEITSIYEREAVVSAIGRNFIKKPIFVINYCNFGGSESFEWEIHLV